MDVNLEVFSGPLDLLLRLIRRKEINIYDIPIAQVAEDYIEALRGVTPDMGEMSEFLVLAATLLEIKSNMLLPRPAEDAEEDPREALARRLLAYEEAQALAKALAELAPAGDVYSSSGEPELLYYLSAKAAHQPVMDLVPLSQLSELFDRVMKLKEGRLDKVRADYGQMPREQYTVGGKVTFILDALRERGKISLFSLFGLCRARRELVVTFLAILELMRRGLVMAIQNRAFSDVEVTQCRA